MNRSRLDILRPGRTRPVMGLPQGCIYGSHPVHHVVPLVPEDELGAAINYAIGPGWPSPAPLVHVRQVHHRDNQSRVISRGECGCVLHRTQRRLRTIGADHQGLIGAHYPPRPLTLPVSNEPALFSAFGATRGTYCSNELTASTGNQSTPWSIDFKFPPVHGESPKQPSPRPRGGGISDQSDR